MPHVAIDVDAKLEPGDVQTLPAGRDAAIPRQ
jgi:hypothetical protein